MNFDIKRKGYHTEQVDAYIKQLKTEYELKAADQKDRIFELKQKLSEAEKKLEEYYGREADVSRALVFAIQKAEEIEETAKKKYELELQRLRMFHTKWQKHFNEILKKYPVDDNLVAIADFSADVEEVLKKSGAAKGKTKSEGAAVKAVDAQVQFERETARLSTREGGETAPIEAIEAYLKNNSEALKKGKKSAPAPKPQAAPEVLTEPAAASASAFSMEEALNPTDDLEDILRDLGIGDD